MNGERNSYFHWIVMIFFSWGSFALIRVESDCCITKNLTDNVVTIVQLSSNHKGKITIRSPRLSTSLVNLVPIP